MDDKLREEIEGLVTKIFSDKISSEQKDSLVASLEGAKTELEDAVEKITEMASTIDDLNIKLNDVSEVVTNKDTEIAEIKEELKTATETIENSAKENSDVLDKKDVEITAVKEELGKVSTELDDLKKDNMATVRMADLEEAGVARTDEEGCKVQREKIKVLSDEEFASYKDELVAIKESIIASIGNTTTTTSTTDVGEVTVNLEGDTGNTPTVEDIGAALADLFAKKDSE